MSAPDLQQPTPWADSSAPPAAASSSDRPNDDLPPTAVAAGPSDNRHAMFLPEPNLRSRDGADPQQPMHDAGADPIPESAAALDSDQAMVTSSPMTTPPGRSISDRPTDSASPIRGLAGPLDNRHATRNPKSKGSLRDGVDPQQSTVDTRASQGASGAPSAAHTPEQQGHGEHVSQTPTALLLWDPVLQTLADGLDDVESTRIAQANRYRILTTTKPDEDSVVRGFGLAEDHPAVAALDAQLKTLEFLDAQMSKALQKQLRAHPLHPWVKQQKGLGDKTVARLLAAVRDPYWNDLHDRPRKVSELFAFCGVAGPGYQRQRGVKVNWNPDARKRLWIIATTIVKVGGPYREVYDAARESYADKKHSTECRQCGKKGQPALIGSDWRDGHKHAGAVRKVMREVLRDLWVESRAIYDARAEQ